MRNIAREREIARSIQRQIGKRIEGRRRALNMERNEVAEALQIIPGKYRRYEQGDEKVHSIVLADIARILKTSVAYLQGETQDPAPPVREQLRKRREPSKKRHTQEMEEEVRKLTYYFKRIRTKEVRARLIELTQAWVREQKKE